MSIFERIKSTVKNISLQDVLDTANFITEVSQTNSNNSHRRSDAAIANSTAGLHANPNSYQVMHNILLGNAIRLANNQPGVYVLRLNGKVMKCGRAVYSAGVRWRLQQYYNLKYDGRAQHGDQWSVTSANRNQVRVSWQCCPESKCKELEAKLFHKYGKGPWGLRAPGLTQEDTWPLRI